MSAAASFYPSLSPAMQAFIRVAYGALQALMLMTALPHARRYFLGERWGGYAQRSGAVDALQNPIVGPALVGIWIVAALCVALGIAVVPSAGINLLVCYYFFIHMRWRGVLRGMGAPGFISFWLGAAVFVLELTSRQAPSLRSLGLLVFQIDFAGIMISAGLYKLVSGYRAGQGMQVGMVNPEWGYWVSRWRHWPPQHPLFRFLNEMAWGTEVIAGGLMLIPATRQVGAIAILLSFVFIATQIRLGFLCEMVIVCCLLFVPSGSVVDRVIAAALPISAAQQVLVGRVLPDGLQHLIAACFWCYVFLLPIVRAGMFYNQLAHRALAPALQRMLDAYSNVFGLIIWRVFSIDVVNFFVRIWEEPASGGARRLVSDYQGWPGIRRFRQVAESIAVTSVFTTLKYYPTNRSLFVDRLLRYARTIPHPPSSALVFEWVSVVPRADRFDFVPVVEYRVDTTDGSVRETTVRDIVSVSAAATTSPVHEGARPGSYVPLRH